MSDFRSQNNVLPDVSTKYHLISVTLLELHFLLTLLMLLVMSLSSVLTTAISVCLIVISLSPFPVIGLSCSGVVTGMCL